MISCVIVGTNDYSSRYSGCTNGASLQTSANRLLTSYTAVKAKLQSLRDNLDDGGATSNDVKDKFNAAATVANNWENTKWTNFINSVRSTINLVSDPNTGILYQLECSKKFSQLEWIGQRWEQFDKALCESTVPNVAIIGMSLLLASFFNAFVVICGGCIAIRLNADSKMKKVNNNTKESARPDYSRANETSKSNFE